MKIWSFLQLPNNDDEIQNRSRYEDVLGARYSWDSTVANYSKVQINDRIVLVDSQYILGFSRITKLHIEVGEKDRFRCPECRSTKISPRVELMPKYRCLKCKSEFSESIKETINVVKYHSYYPEKWHSLHLVSKTALESAYFSKAVQQSIRELEDHRMTSILGSEFINL